MLELDLFYRSPTEELFDQLTKEQLLEVAAKYGVPLNSKDKRLKETIVLIVKAALVALKVFDISVRETDEEQDVQISDLSLTFSFEQRKELMLLELEKARLNREVEIRKSEVEVLRFQLISEGKLGNGGAASPEIGCDVSSNIRLLPKFNEDDVDTFFSLFERLANMMKWPEKDQTMMLQCVLTGKAQKAISALSAQEGQKYQKIKGAVLRAYELVPEAYRQKFRNMRRFTEQTYCDFAKDLRIQLDRWCTASGVYDYEELYKLFLVEQFKSTLPEHVSIFLTDRNVRSVDDAAVLVDEYVLTHKAEEKNYRPKLSYSTVGGGFSKQFHSDNGGEKLRSYVDGSDRCAYCHLKGHWKKDCVALKGKMLHVKSEPKSTLTVSSVQTDNNSDCSSNVLQNVEKLVVLRNDGDAGYAAFITDCYVSLVGSDKKFPVKVLRDTGSSESFVLESVLPFSQESDTGTKVLIQGIGLQALSVPLHNVFLQSDLIKGPVVLGIRPSLPVEGVSVILGNNLAGDRVWRDVPPPPMVTTFPAASGEMEFHPMQ